MDNTTTATRPLPLELDGALASAAEFFAGEPAARSMVLEVSTGYSPVWVAVDRTGRYYVAATLDRAQRYSDELSATPTLSL